MSARCAIYHSGNPEYPCVEKATVLVYWQDPYDGTFSCEEGLESVDLTGAKIYDVDDRGNVVGEARD